MAKKSGTKNNDKDYDIAYDFSAKAYKKFQEIIKAIVLFGSISKNQPNPNSDIDLVIIIDDCTVNWDEELIAWYREELQKLISKQSYAQRLHINTITLSVFWEEIKEGEPIAINLIRYGQTLIDLGSFFNPLKAMLAKGKIHPTPEAVYVTMQRAEGHLDTARKNLLVAVEGFYWAMVDSAHSTLMALGITPPSPEHISELMLTHLVKTRRADKKYVEYYNEVRKLAKDIVYGNVRKVPGRKLDDLHSKTEQFVKYFRDLTMILIKDKKIIRTEEKKI